MPGSSHKLSIVLVGPQGDANIGAAARAMKNFGFTDLRLVEPAVSHLTRPAFTWAVDARDVLEQARTFASLDAALADTAYVAAFTRRIGRGRKRQLLLAEAAPVIAARAGDGGTALVFGREDKGLSNEEIRRCDAVVEIPTSDKLPSLNLAQAVLLACYEVRSALDHEPAESEAQNPRPSRSQEHFLPREDVALSLARIDAMLRQLGYEDTPEGALRSRILAQFEKIFGRAGLTPRDAGMIEGLAARVAEVMTLKE